MENDVLTLNEENEPEYQQAENSEQSTKSKRIDPVWEYFLISKENKKLHCNLCKHPRQFKYTTDCPSITLAKKHLQSFHMKQYKLIENTYKKKDKNEKKKKDTNQSQLPFSPEKKYSLDHWK